MKTQAYFVDRLKSHLGITTLSSFLTHLYNYELQFTAKTLGEHLLTTPLPQRVFQDNLILLPADEYDEIILFIPESLCYQALLKAHPYFPSYGELLGGGCHVKPTSSKRHVANRAIGYNYSGVSFSISCLRDQFAAMEEL